MKKERIENDGSPEPTAFEAKLARAREREETAIEEATVKHEAALQAVRKAQAAVTEAERALERTTDETSDEELHALLRAKEACVLRVGHREETARKALVALAKANAAKGRLEGAVRIDAQRDGIAKIAALRERAEARRKEIEDIDKEQEAIFAAEVRPMMPDFNPHFLPSHSPDPVMAPAPGGWYDGVAGLLATMGPPPPPKSRTNHPVGDAALARLESYALRPS